MLVRLFILHASCLKIVQSTILLGSILRILQCSIIAIQILQLNSYTCSKVVIFILYFNSRVLIFISLFICSQRWREREKRPSCWHYCHLLGLLLNTNTINVFRVVLLFSSLLCKHIFLGHWMNREMK